MIANVPGSVAEVPAGVRVIHNAQPHGFAANANRGFAETSGAFVVVSNPDAVPEPGAVATLRTFAEAHERCGIAGPRMLGVHGELVPSRRRFPTRLTPCVRICRAAPLG